MPHDCAIQSTFESNPSKSVADFPASEPFGPPTSAATSELEAKLRQRMLKCEGSDVLYRPQSSKSREKSASRTPARLKQTILKKNMEMMEPSKAQHLNSQDTAKVDELVETASYQRCTKARARSAHSLTRKKVGASYAHAHAGESSPEIAPEVSPEVHCTLASGTDSSPAPAAERIEMVLTPRSGAGSTVAISDYGSVASQYEFFEPGEVGCATFALDDPTRDAMEEAGDDIGSPRMLDSMKRVEYIDGTTDGDISIEECLFDLVNHIPPHLAQKIGFVLQHLEEAKRSGSFHQSSDDDDPASWEDVEDEETAAEDLQQLPLMEASKAPETGHPRPRKPQRFAPPLQLDSRERQRQLQQHQEDARRVEELLEQRMQSEVAAMTLETKTLRDELFEARGVERLLEQTRRETEKRLEMQKLRVQAMSTALAGADSRLAEAAIRLHTTERLRDKLRSEVLSQETELVALRDSLLRTDEKLQISEQQKAQFAEQTRVMEQMHMQFELEAQSMKAASEQARRHLVQTAAMEWQQDETLPSLSAELERVKQQYSLDCERLQKSEAVQEGLLNEVTKAEVVRVELEAEVLAVTSKEERDRQDMELELLAAGAATPNSIAELMRLRGQLEKCQGAEEQVSELRSALEEEKRRLWSCKEATKHHRELWKMSQQAVVEAEELHWRVSMASQGQRNEDLLSEEWSSALAEQEHLRIRLDRQQAELEEERANCASIQERNEALREEQRRLSAELRQQQEFLQRKSAELLQGDSSSSSRRRGERQAEAEPETLERDVEALRSEVARWKAVLAERASSMEKERGLRRLLAEKSLEVQEERRLQEHYIARSEHEHAECAQLQKHLENERLKVQDETVRRVYLERVSANLSEEKETLSARYSAGVAEIGACRERETQLEAQVTSLRLSLARGQEELQQEQQARKRLVTESEELEASHSHLETELEASKAGRSSGLFYDACIWDSSFAGLLQSSGRKGSQRNLHLEEVCRVADAEVAAQAKAMRLNESLRRQLCIETKYAVHEAEELRIAMDARTAAQSEELREAEVRREQLEAETSLMAMEVATLSKDLGGRLLEDGSLGLTRRPFTVHEILREAWRNGNTAEPPFRSPLSMPDERSRGKAARDAYFVNLYLKWLRRGPYRILTPGREHPQLAAHLLSHAKK